MCIGIADVGPGSSEAAVGDVRGFVGGQTAYCFGGKVYYSRKSAALQCESSFCDTLSRCIECDAEVISVGGAGRCGGNGVDRGLKIACGAYFHCLFEVGGAYIHGGAARNIYSCSTHVDCRAVYRSVDFGVGAYIVAPELIFFIAPDIFGHFGMVDKGVAVALPCIHCFLAVAFLVAHRVLPVPFQQQFHRPAGKCRIRVSGQHWR